MMPKIGIGGTGNIDGVQMDEQASTPSTPGAGKSAIFLKADGLYVIDDAGAVTGPLVASAGSGYTEGARVYHDANQSINTATLTPLAFNTERYDTDTIHDAGANTRLTCKTAGKYLIVCHVQWESNATGYRELALRLDGTTYIAVTSLPVVAAVATYQIATTIYDLALNAYVEALVQHNRGSALNILTAANFSPEFMMQRIG